MRIDFSQENKSKGNDRYPKLTLDKDEVARVGILEMPMLKYVHVLNMPVVDPVTGEHVKVVAKNSKNEEYEKDAYDFVAQVVCTGDLTKVRESEIDPDNCLACKDVAEHADKFKAPDAKYVAHVIKYRTQPGTVQPQNPFQAELVLWVLTQRKFDKIVNIAAEFGDPRQIDLQLGPCSNKGFQNYEMAACNGGAVWAQQEANKNFVGQLWSANAADEEAMTNTVARPLSPTRYSADSAKVIERYGMIGRPQGSGVGDMEFGGIAQASQGMAQQSEQPAPWSQQGPPSFVTESQQQAAPQQSFQQPPAQQEQPAPWMQQSAPQAAPQQSFQPQQQAAPQPGAPTYDQPPQFPQAAPQPTEQQAPASQQGQFGQQPPAQQEQQAFQPQQQAPAQGGNTLDFQSLVAEMNSPNKG